MEEGASTSATQKPKSAIERAILNFIDVLSNAQSEVTGKTGITPAGSLPPAGRQTTREIIRRKVQRLFPATIQKTQYRRKRPFQATDPDEPAAHHIKLNFCLLPASTTTTPNNEEGFLEAGLGRRTIGIADDADHEQITRALHKEYPKMKTLTGGWLLYKAAGGKGKRRLSVLAQEAEGYTSEMLKTATIRGRHTLYIVPDEHEPAALLFPATIQKTQYRRKQPFQATDPDEPAAHHIKLNFCLLPASTTTTPNNEEQGDSCIYPEEGFLEAGLGRRTIGIADDADHEQITRALHKEYPKMKTLTGGWLLYKAAGGKGKRRLSVLAQEAEGYTSEMLKTATIRGRHTLYIVPDEQEPAALLFPATIQKTQYRRKQPFQATDPDEPAAHHIKLNFCLLPASTTTTPNNEEGFLEAGLGRRTIGIADDADHEQITRALHEEYPKMKTLTGGWLLYKAAGGKGKRRLSVLSQEAEGYTSEMLKTATIRGRHTLYIVPLQEELDTSPLPHDAAQLSKMPKSHTKAVD